MQPGSFFLIVAGAIQLIQAEDAASMNLYSLEGIALLRGETAEERITRFQMLLEQFPDPMEALLKAGERQKNYNSIYFRRTPLKQLPSNLQLSASIQQRNITQSTTSRPTSSSSSSTMTTFATTTQGSPATSITTPRASTSMTSSSQTTATVTSHLTSTATSTSIRPTTEKAVDASFTTDSATAKEFASSRVSCKPSVKSPAWLAIPAGICVTIDEFDSVCAVRFSVFEASQSKDCAGFDRSWCCYVPELRRS